MIIFGFIKIGETGYSEISFFKENSGGSNVVDSSLGDDVFSELERLPSLHLVERINAAIKVYSREPLPKVKEEVNNVFLRLCGIVPNYMTLSE